MTVYDIGVRYMRKVQVKEYEPVEAEVSLKAQLAEGEDYSQVGNKLMADARTMVLDGIANKAAGKAKTGDVAVTEEKVEAKTEEKTVAAKRGRPKKEAEKATEKPADDFDFESKEAEGDTFDGLEDGEKEEAGEEVISAPALREFFTEVIRKNIGITPTIIKKKLADHKAAGTSDLSDEARGEIHAWLLEAVKKSGK